MDVTALTLMLFPYVFQIATCNERKVIVTYDFTVVANHATGASSVFHEVQLHDFMTVNRVVELFLATISHIHKIVLTQWGYLM